MVVAEKWTGTNADRHDMEKLQLDQVLRRNFGRLAMFGFASTLICTWEILLASISLSYLNGGAGGLFWNYAVVCIGFAAVYSSLSEIGSLIPTSGGQYYWVAVLAPPRAQKYLSYVTGWLCTMAWQTGISSVAFLSGTIIQSLLVLNIDDYQPQRWQGTLFIMAIALVAISFNTFLAKKLPLVEGILVILHLLGIVIVIPLWVLLPRRSGGAVLTEFYNGGGWSSIGVSTTVGMLPTFSSMLGLDCSVHMAEETKDSSRTLPVSLMLGFGINAVLGYFVVLTIVYTGGEPAVLLNSKTGYPFVDMFYNATQSRAATTIMTLFMIISLTASAIAVLATASRQLWAFARNKGVPFADHLAPPVLSFDIPINALLVSLTFTIVLSLINIGSTAALNAIWSLSNGCLISSYVITIGCNIYNRLLGTPLPPARYNLGRFGLPLNIFSICFLLTVYVFSFFPPNPNPTAVEMNWGSLMYGSAIIAPTVWYFIRGRHRYTPPQDDVIAAIKTLDRFYVDSNSDTGEAGMPRKEQVTVLGKME